MSRSDPALEPALVELRRQHRNAGFWETPRTGPWYGIPTALESLKALQAQGGYYAGVDAPMESLCRWGQACLGVLLGADGLWSSEPGCQGLWLALSQQLKGQTKAIEGSPQAEKWLESLAGEEVVYVGWNWSELKRAHRNGALFTSTPFGLRGLELADSRRGLQPDRDFGVSLEHCLEQLEALHQERPFAVVCSDAGAYRLPVLQAASSRYGTRGLACCSLPEWLGLGQ